MAQLSPKIKFYDKEKLKKINPETLAFWKKYEIDMSLRELSDKSKAGYRNDMEHVWLFLYDNYDNISMTEVTEDIIEDFLYFCKTQGNNSRRIKRRLSTISAFYKFLRRKKLIENNPVEFIERSKKDVDVMKQTYLTEEQIQEIEDKLESEFDSGTSVHIKHFSLMLHVYAMFSLSTMARVNAVRNIKWGQIDFQNRVVSEVLEKEGYIVDLYFSEHVRELLERLKTFRTSNQIIDNGYLFIGSFDGEIQGVTTSTMNKWCKRIGEIINVSTLHAHDFRHSGSQLMSQKGCALEDISEALNHKGVEVTRKHYLIADKKKIREARDKFGI